MTSPVSGTGSGEQARPPIAVFLLDDHEIVRRGLRDLLEAEEDLTVVGEASTAEEALGRIPATQPDVAVLDVRLGEGGDDTETTGIEVCREVRSRHPEVRCLMLTSFADDEALFAAIMAGASGYVLKQVRGTDLVDALRRVGRLTVSTGRSVPVRRAGGTRRGSAGPSTGRRSSRGSAGAPRRRSTGPRHWRTARS